MEPSVCCPSYQLRDHFTTASKESASGTCASTPTGRQGRTGFDAEREMAAATASSRKFEALISSASAAGGARPIKACSCSLSSGPFRGARACRWLERERMASAQRRAPASIRA